MQRWVAPLSRKLPEELDRQCRKIQHEFTKTLEGMWPKRGRMGLAVSGGMDSMALALLCHGHKKTVAYQLKHARRAVQARVKDSFVAFIVDHGIRADSSAEASSVAKVLEQLEITTQILRLDWSSFGHPSSLSNLESIARTLRYQALGKACLDNSTNTLLVAHHADDVAETVMSRALTGYTGFGLAGIKSHAPLPECSGIYGIDQSGGFLTPGKESQPSFQAAGKRFMIEQGGVSIFRPLLHLSKTQLGEICLARNLSWFEDPTNADPTLTTRNTVRSLQATNALPKALRTQRLLQVAQTANSARSRAESQANTLFRVAKKNVALEMGLVSFSLDSSREEMQLTASPAARAFFTRRLVELVSPKSKVALQDLDQAVNLIYSSSPPKSDSIAEEEPAAVQVAGVNIRQSRARYGEGHLQFRLRRAVPTRAESLELKLRLSTEYQLWDKRYWIRIIPPPDSADDLEVSIGFLTDEDVANVRRTCNSCEMKDFALKLGGVKSESLRCTLPVMTARRAQTPGNISQESYHVVALPSLGWSTQQWRRYDGTDAERHQWRYDIRYKHIDKYE